MRRRAIIQPVVERLKHILTDKVSTLTTTSVHTCKLIEDFMPILGGQILAEPRRVNSPNVVLYLLWKLLPRIGIIGSPVVRHIDFARDEVPATLDVVEQAPQRDHIRTLIEQSADSEYLRSDVPLIQQVRE